MITDAIIPVKTLASSKKRLGALLTMEERIKLSEAMLHDVLDSVSHSPSIGRILVVSKDESVRSLAEDFGTAFLREEEQRGVNAAVALADRRVWRASDADATIVIPHDLPLITPRDIEMVCRAAIWENMCVIVAPSYRYDGTNILLRKPPNIMKTHYDEDSYEIHVRKASENKKKRVAVKIMLNRRMMLDLDEPKDIAQILASKPKKKCRTLSYLRRIRPKLET